VFGGISGVSVDGRPATDDAVIAVVNEGGEISLLHHWTNYASDL
jgi:hypothetical protein